MGGTIRRLVQQGHDVHIAYETSGNIAVGDEEVTRFMHFINGFNQLFGNNADEVIRNKYQDKRQYQPPGLAAEFKDYLFAGIKENITV